MSDETSSRLDVTKSCFIDVRAGFVSLVIWVKNLPPSESDGGRCKLKFENQCFLFETLHLKPLDEDIVRGMFLHVASCRVASCRAVSCPVAPLRVVTSAAFRQFAVRRVRLASPTHLLSSTQAIGGLPLGPAPTGAAHHVSRTSAVR